jgi:hypothetical protein
MLLASLCYQHPCCCKLLLWSLRLLLLLMPFPPLLLTSFLLLGFPPDLASPDVTVVSCAAVDPVGGVLTVALLTSQTFLKSLLCWRPCCNGTPDVVLTSQLLLFSSLLLLMFPLLLAILLLLSSNTLDYQTVGRESWHTERTLYSAE